jgi:hypothetical protein
LRVLLEKQIPGIDQEGLLCAFPDIFNPTTPSGKTADLARLPSGGARFDLSVEVIAVKKGQGSRCLLRVQRRRRQRPENPEAQENDENRFSLH